MTHTTIRTRDAAAEFLACRRIAVTGVSRTPGSHGGNVVYCRLRERGYDVFAVNPYATSVEGDPAYDSLRTIPGGVEAVVIATRPALAEATVREADDVGARYIWMHHGPGPSSVSEAATHLGRAAGMTVIDGGCPLMFDPTSDGAHRVMCRLFTLTGRVPRRV